MQSQLHRKSPRAPSISLEKALVLAFSIYDQEKLHETPLETAAQAMGFTNAGSGSASSVFASLRYFGLIERRNEGLLSVSRDIELYKYAPSELMRRQILMGFLNAPPLYHELLLNYPNRLPTKAQLKNELIQKHFLPQTVDQVLSAFLESVSFAGYFDAQPELSLESAQPRVAVEVPAKLADEIVKTPNDKMLGEIQLILDSPGDFDQIPVRLSGGRKAWIAVPTPFYESDKARMKAQIDVLFVDTEMPIIAR